MNEKDSLLIREDYIFLCRNVRLQKSLGRLFVECLTFLPESTYTEMITSSSPNSLSFSRISKSSQVLSLA